MFSLSYQNTNSIKAICPSLYSIYWKAWRCVSSKYYSRLNNSLTVSSDRQPITPVWWFTWLLEGWPGLCRTVKQSYGSRRFLHSTTNLSKIFTIGKMARLTSFLKIACIVYCNSITNTTHHSSYISIYATLSTS